MQERAPGVDPLAISERRSLSEIVEDRNRERNEHAAWAMQRAFRSLEPEPVADAQARECALNNAVDMVKANAHRRPEEGETLTDVVLGMAEEFERWLVR